MQSAGNSPPRLADSDLIDSRGLAWKVVAAAGAVLLVGSLLSPILFGRLTLSGFMLLAVGLCLCTLALLQSARILTRPRLVAIAGVDVLFLVLFGWSMTQSMPVRIEVHGNTLAGYAADRTISIDEESLPGRQAGLYLGGFSTSRTYETSLYDSSNLLVRLSRLSARTYPREAWHNLSVKQKQGISPLEPDSVLGNGAVVNGSWNKDETSALTALDGGVLIFDPSRPDDLILRGDLMRSGVAGGLIAGADKDGNGYVFAVDTERERVGWYEMKNGQIGDALSTTYYRHSFTGLLQSLLRTAGLMYIYALGLLVGAGAVALGVSRLFRQAPDVESPAGMGAARGFKRFTVALTISAGLVALASLALSSFVALGPLEGIPHVQDEVAYLFQAKTFALGKFWVPAAPYPEFFQNPFILTIDGHWFSKYPPGHSLILALGALVGQPWIIGPLLGAGSLLIVYFTGKEMWSARTGLIAAVLGLTSPFVIFMSASYLAHTTTMFFIALFVLGYVKAVRSGGWTWALVAGIAIGLAFITRQLTAVGVALPFVVFSLVEMRHDWRRTLRTSALIIAGFVPVLVFLLLYNRMLTGSPLMFPHNLVGSYDSLGFGSGIGGVPEGHTLAQALWNTARNLESMASYLFGWPVYISFALISLPFLVGKPSKWDFLMLGGIVALVMAYLFWWAVALIFGPRYWYEILPFLFLLSARGIEALFGFLRDTAAWMRRGPALKWANYVAAVVVCSLLGVLIYYNIGQYMPYQLEQYTGYNEITREPIGVVERAGIGNAVVFYRPPADIANRGYGPVFSENSPLLDTSVIFARDLGTDKNKALLAKFPGRKGYLLDQNRLSEMQ